MLKKNSMNNIKFPFRFLMLISLLIIAACGNDEEDIAPIPTSDNATFSYTFDPENANNVIFNGQPDVDTWYTHWDFGDNTAAESLQIEKLYFLKGEYEVRFKIFTEGGTAESVQTISIAEDIIGPNLVENGALNGDDSWTVLSILGGVEVAFQNGAATWTGGGGGHVGIYQPISIEANTTYQVNMDIVGSGLTDSWFEVYIGTTVPMDGVDYTDGGMRLGLNTWEGCGSDPFDTAFSVISCLGDGIFEFPNAVNAYLVIRGGGADYGAAGVTIDNVSIRAL
ncbi:MAG: hypothetical protein ACI9XO_003333 [Paraglaciecola sp.]